MVNLAGYIYNDDDLRQARAFLIDRIRTHDPDWLQNPVGYVATDWNSDTLPSALNLIHLAVLLNNFQKNITERSVPVFARKLVQLLRTPDSTAFEELLAELRVGALLGLRAGPIACEPLVPAELLGSPSQPPSPDYGIRLPGGDVIIEVTTLHVEAFDRWERALKDIKKRVEGAIIKGTLQREIVIKAPLGIRADQLSRNLLRTLGRALREQNSGTMALKLEEHELGITWAPVPHVSASAGIPPGSRSAVSSSGGVRIGSIAVLSVVPVLGPEVEDLVLHSLRNTIDGKREQITGDSPALLVLQLGQERMIPPEYIMEVTRNRLWPNPRYGWLTGVGLFSPIRAFNIAAPKSTLVVTWNPNARRPPTEALRALIEDGVRYDSGVRVKPTDGVDA